MGGEWARTGALGGDDSGSVVENCGVGVSCVGEDDGMEVTGSGALGLMTSSGNFGGGVDASCEGGGMLSSCMETDQELRENGIVGTRECVESDGNNHDLFGTVGDRMIEGGGFVSGAAEQSTKKRKRQGGRGKVNPDTPLRRSARRVALENPERPVISPGRPSQAANDTASANQVDDEGGVCAPELPSSSKSPNLDGLPVLDVFSVYSCLRSFSTSLFLSPFSLEAFVEALNCRFANSLSDHVHFSLLTVLKKRLQSLSNERNIFASDCLRALNWELLDLEVWPFYLVEYILLFHASSMGSCLELSSMRLLDSEYYTQPGRIKIRILRLLCDDVLEGDFIRLELQRHMMGSDPNVDSDQDMVPQSRNENCGANNMPITLGSDDMGEEGSDRNFDDCCLCKMDGVLICCDGCPAAFHSRCAGLVKDALPEGDWYCPECLMGKVNPIQLLKPFRGAEVLGTDIHGRIYFGSCGYLLVSDFHDADACLYYSKCDIGAVIDILLKSSPSHCIEITTALSLYHGDDKGIPFEIASLAPLNCSGSAASKQNVIDFVAVDFSPQDKKPMGNHSTVARVTQKADGVFATCSRNLEFSLDTVDASVQEESKTDSDHAGSMGWPILRQSLPIVYTNHYSFGLVVSYIAELILKPPEVTTIDAMVTTDDLVVKQVKAISEAIMKLGWPLVQKLSSSACKERCGWCLSCRSIVEGECLLTVTEKKFAGEAKKFSLGLRSIKHRKSHLISAAHQLLVVEDNLHGLLSGPWENPAYRKQWQKNILKATDVKALKKQLLILEVNLRQVVLSADWPKLLPIDTDLIFGSACHIFTVPVMDPSKHFGGRKRGRKSKPETKKPSLDTGVNYHVGESGFCWWRGGRLSRQVFHWRVLPRNLVSKGARQAGCQKITGLVYPEGTEFPRRSRRLAWSAGLELSRTVPEFIFYVKDLDSNIKWNDIKNTTIFPNSAKENAQMKPLKNVLIRRKCVDEQKVNYIVDFGRRKNVPDAITKCAVSHQESASGRKKYWLNEYDIPLGLLKAFEVRKLEQAAKNNKLAKKNLLDENFTKASRPKGFSYLFSKPQKSEYQNCAYCNKDVLVREAISCQSCEGIFHRKHFRVPKSVTDAVYTCLACIKKEASELRKSKEGDSVETSKVESIKLKQKKKKRGMVKDQPERSKAGIPEFKDAPQNKNNLLILKGQERTKLVREGKKAHHGEVFASLLKAASLFRRKRTPMQHPYWCNGLQWSVKSSGERCRIFQLEYVLMPVTHSTGQCLNPVCFLCHEEYNSNMIYLHCKNCGDWCHGVSVAVTLENVKNLMGFRCYKCRLTSSHICPCSKTDLNFKGNPNNDEVFDTNVNVDSDEMQHSDNDLFTSGSVQMDVLTKELPKQFMFSESQCAMSYDSKIGNVGLASNVANHLQQAVLHDDDEVLQDENSISGKETSSTFVDPSKYLNCEQNMFQEGAALGEHASLQNLQRYDAEGNMPIDAWLAQQVNNLALEVSQIGPLNQEPLLRTNSPGRCHSLVCNNRSARHGHTDMVNSHGVQRHVDDLSHGECKVCTYLADEHQEKGYSKGQPEGLMHEADLQYSQRLAETELCAKKSSLEI